MVNLEIIEEKEENIQRTEYMKTECIAKGNININTPLSKLTSSLP